MRWRAQLHPQLPPQALWSPAYGRRRGGSGGENSRLPGQLGGERVRCCWAGRALGRPGLHSLPSLPPSSLSRAGVSVRGQPPRAADWRRLPSGPRCPGQGQGPGRKEARACSLGAGVRELAPARPLLSGSCPQDSMQASSTPPSGSLPSLLLFLLREGPSFHPSKPNTRQLSPEASPDHLSPKLGLAPKAPACTRNSITVLALSRVHCPPPADFSTRAWGRSWGWSRCPALGLPPPWGTYCVPGIGNTMNKNETDRVPSSGNSHHRADQWPAS